MIIPLTRHAISVLLAAALVGAGCHGDRASQDPAPEKASPSPTDSAPIAIAGPKNIAMLPLVASKRGMFAAEKVSATYEPLQTGKLAMDAVVSGDVDAGVIVDANIAHALFQPGVDLVVVAAVMSKTDDALVARADRGIRTARDLVGHSIGYVPGTTSDSFLWRFLAREGIDPKSVKLAATTPPALQAAMAHGDVDAAAIWQPWRFNIAKELGDNAAQIANDGAYVGYAVLVVRRETAERRADSLAAVLRALLRAERYTIGDPEARALLAAEIPIDRATLDATWEEYRIHVGLDEGLLANLKAEGEHLRSTKPEYSGKAQPAYEKVIDARLLRSVAPDRVRVP